MWFILVDPPLPDGGESEQWQANSLYWLATSPCEVTTSGGYTYKLWASAY